jgi:hypothetical protein
MIDMPLKPTPTHIANILDIIRHGHLNSDGTRRPANLAQLKKNVETTVDLSDDDRAMLLDEIKGALRKTNNRIANKIYGPREDEAKANLERIFKQLSIKYDLSDNHVGNGVKIGGDMIAGRVFVDVYFSFKNGDKWHTTFAWIQDNPESGPYFKVANYRNSREDPSLVEECFPLEKEAAAIDLYEQHLQRLLRG